MAKPIYYPKTVALLQYRC